MYLNIAVCMANSVDSDQMPYSAASDLGLHCLQWPAYLSQYLVVLYFLQVLCGNKSDLASERQVTKDQGSELAKKLNIPFVETSAKTGDNVTQAFEELVRNTPRPGFGYKVCTSTVWLINTFTLSGLFYHISLDHSS